MMRFVVFLSCCLLLSSVFLQGCEKRKKFPVVPPKEKKRAYVKIVNTAESKERGTTSGIFNDPLDFVYHLDNTFSRIAFGIAAPTGWPLEGYANLVQAGIDVDSFGIGRVELTANLNIATQQPDVEVMNNQPIALYGDQKQTIWIVDSLQTLIARTTLDNYRFTDTTFCVRFYHGNFYQKNPILLIMRSPRPNMQDCELGKDSVFIKMLSLENITPFLELWGDRSYKIQVWDTAKTVQLVPEQTVNFSGGSAHNYFYHKNNPGGSAKLSTALVE